MHEIKKQRMIPNELAFPVSPYENRSTKDPEMPIHSESSVTFTRSLQFEKLVSGPGEDLKNIPLPPGARVLKRKIPPLHSILKSVAAGENSPEVLAHLRQYFLRGGRSEKLKIRMRLRVMDREDLMPFIQSRLEEGRDRS